MKHFYCLPKLRTYCDDDIKDANRRNCNGDMAMMGTVHAQEHQGMSAVIDWI
jgi:hypothetical protein